MRKLNLSTPGFNAGQSFCSKMVRISDITIDPEISAIFKVEERMITIIREKIKEEGFYKDQPVAVWRVDGRLVLVDGRTRLTAAKEAGLEEIPAVEKEFEDRAAAMMFTFERQAVRRNLSSAEIIQALELLPKERNRKGDGRAAGHLAEFLGVSETIIYDGLKVTREAAPEVVEAVRNGQMSIKAAKATLKKPKAEKDSPSTDTYRLPANVKFLKDAVILLVEANQNQAAELLINHYLKKDERNGFYKLLPESMRETFILETGESGLAGLV